MEEVRRAGSLDDPMLKLQTEGVPFKSPGLDNAMDNMFGLSQNLPWPGNLGLREEAAMRDAEATFQTYRERERDLIARAKRAYFDYFMLSKELAIHREHVKILEDFEKISDAKFRTGQVMQQDVLKPQVEIVMLHNDVYFIEQRLATARATINLLLNRSDDAPLGLPRDVVLTEATFDLKELQARALQERPEILAAQLRHRGSLAGLRLAEREATFPDFSVGVDYWQVPGGDDAYGAMLSINLPWFTGKHAAEKRKMGHLARADEIAVERIRAHVAFEVRAAFLRVEAARKSVQLFAGELLPKSRQSVEVSQSSYEKDKASFLDLLDAERSLRDVKVKYYQALAEYESALADLERAVGADLRRKP
jgi:outer membrane protein TolC